MTVNDWVRVVDVAGVNLGWLIALWYMGKFLLYLASGEK